MRMIPMNLKYMYTTYAIVMETNDQCYNNGECYLVIFQNKEEYEDYIKDSNEEQPYTGKSWRTLYKNG